MSKKNKNEYRFEIKAYSPETMPLNLLSEYLKDIAILLGEANSVHLIRIDDGSTAPVFLIENEAVPKVERNLQLVRNNEAPEEQQKAQERINNRLRNDNGFGYIVSPDNSKVIEFPGVKKKLPIDYGRFTQYGTIDGVPINIGGKNDSVPIHLEGKQGEISICYTNREIAKTIARYLFTTIIRVEGNGRWQRHSNGEWELVHFAIKDFQELRQKTLSEDLTDLRAIGAKWKELDDPLGELDIIQHSEIQ